MSLGLLQRTPERQAVHDQVMRLIANGESSSRIAAIYGIPAVTIRNWKANYLRKQRKRSTSVPVAVPCEHASTELQVSQDASGTIRDILQDRAISGIAITDDLRIGLGKGLGDVQATLINSASALAEMTHKNSAPITSIDEAGVMLNYVPLGLSDHKSAVGTVKVIGETLAKMHNLMYGVQGAPREPTIKEGSKHLHYHSHGGAGSKPSGKVIYRHDVPHLPAPSTATVIDADIIDVIDAQEVD